MLVARHGTLGLLCILLACLARISPTERPEPNSGIGGRVLAENVPVPGATVRWQATSLATTTDTQGFFRLPHVSPPRRITASKPGFLIAGAPAPFPFTLQLTPLPREDHEAYAWVDPTPRAGDAQRCGNCHAEMYGEWSASGHARSATGRHFRNLYEGTDWHGHKAGWRLLNDHPDGAGVCAACHAPALAPGDPARFDLRQIDGVAARGVHCDYCHKIADVDRGELGLSHGTFNLRLLRPARGQLFFGPLDDVDRGEDACVPLYRDSRYCASCHEGIVFGVPVYTTWSEWLESPARREGKQCQDCHMKPTGRMTNVAPGRGGLERDPRTLANHRFFDGSREEMIRNCLHVTTRFERRGQDFTLEVAIVAQGAGHRVPTGFIDRHLVLHLEARDAAGQIVAAQRGPQLPASVGPMLAGKSGRLFARVLTDSQGRSPAPFWQPTHEPVDTRLRPGEKEVILFDYPARATRLRLQLTYRRFWAEVARSKAWPDDELTILDKVLEVAEAAHPIQADKFDSK